MWSTMISVEAVSVPKLQKQMRDGTDRNFQGSFCFLFDSGRFQPRDNPLAARDNKHDVKAGMTPRNHNGK